MTVMVGKKVSKMALKCPKIVGNCLTSSYLEKEPT